ncbi:MAG TPA: NAD-dependent epimerase/dehydratase family protein [Microthrixaceae bacterium]|nr:NAD-dependent epimerase/dehydratase family protein [Microthrixaceae bacterium]
MAEIDLVTGAAGYSGSYVARRLLEQGRTLRTLTRDTHTVPPPVEASPYRFDEPSRMLEAFDGVDTFYNTYWVRFARGSVNHDHAVRNSVALVEIAASAGVRRMVHVSIMQPDQSSPYTYHRGKALVEHAVMESGMEYAIVRPSVLFGGEDILLNNIAWLLRRLHVFAVPGDGRYAVRPTHVEDLADLMVELGSTRDSVVRNAGGPDVFEFGALVRLIRDAVGAKALVVNLPKAMVLPLVDVVNRLTGDVTLHREELDALMDGLASCDGEAAGPRRLTDHLAALGSAFGANYQSEVARNFSVRAEEPETAAA